MLRRLLEADYFSTTPEQVAEEKVRFWLRELRTPELLVQVAAQYRRIAESLSEARSLIQAALARDRSAVEQGLQQEMKHEIILDREYWAPLKRQLEQLRRSLRD